MAPVKPKSTKGSAGKKGGKSSSGGAASKVKKRTSAKQKDEQVKTKPTTSGPAKKKKQRVYTEKELGIPTLNMITPAGVQKPKGKKKGKVFVDDQESMMTILAMVNAEKEGQIESKMMKARQLEEIREARRKEAEARQEQKKSKLEEAKDAVRKNRKRKGDTAISDPEPKEDQSKPAKSSRKRVSFG